MSETPYTESGLRKFDGLLAIDAILAAWNEPGRDPLWHAKKKGVVRSEMPVLARALDRASAERALR